MSLDRLAGSVGALLLAGSASLSTAVAAPPLAGAPVVADAAAPAVGYDGTVEAVRQTVVSAQVPGTILAVPVTAGERVKAGQVLVRIDARAAEQQAAAARARLQAARAADDAATRELERQRQLFQKHYISQAALDRAEAQYKSASAQSASESSSAQAAQTESGYFTIRAPYDGVISELRAVQGDMAGPGRPLLVLYDPAALRVTAAVPQTAAPAANAAPLAELGGTPARRLAPVRWQSLPAADAATHTVQVRLDLPPGTAAVPGAFARVWLPASTGGPARLWVPGSAVVRRAELTGVYVIADDGHPALRQVRLGPAEGERVEILAGVEPGERVALDPQAAARVR